MATHTHTQPHVASSAPPNAPMHLCIMARIVSDRLARDCDSNQGIISPFACASVPSNPPHATAPASEPKASSLAGATSSALAFGRGRHHAASAALKPTENDHEDDRDRHLDFEAGALSQKRKLPKSTRRKLDLIIDCKTLASVQAGGRPAPLSIVPSRAANVGRAG